MRLVSFVLTLLSGATCVSLSYGTNALMESQLADAQTRWNAAFGGAAVMDTYTFEGNIVDNDALQLIVSEMKEPNNFWILDETDKLLNVAELTDVDPEGILAENDFIISTAAIGQDVYRIHWYDVVNPRSFSTLAIGNSNVGIEYESLLGSVVLEDDTDGNGDAVVVRRLEDIRNKPTDTRVFKSFWRTKIGEFAWSLGCVDAGDGTCKCVQNACRSDFKGASHDIKCRVRQTGTTCYMDVAWAFKKNPGRVAIEVTVPPAQLKVDFTGSGRSAQDVFTVTRPCKKNEEGKCGGDPHFQRFQTSKRDTFHGECDLVLLHKEGFADGKSLDVHVRTTMVGESYSYIEAAAIKVGDDVLEFDMDSIHVNGQPVREDSLPFMFGSGYHIVKVNPEPLRHRVIEVGLNDVRVLLKSTKHFMTVSVELLSDDSEALEGSVGLLGEYGTGDMLARDGVNVLERFIDFGFEWQVDPTANDPQLFMDARSPQLPYERCRMPSTTMALATRKLLRSNQKLYEAALEACTNAHDEENVDLCVTDVMLTGDMDLITAW